MSAKIRDLPGRNGNLCYGGRKRTLIMSENIPDIYTSPLFTGVRQEVVDRLLQQSANKLTFYSAGEWIALRQRPCRSLLLLCEGSVVTTMGNAEGKEVVIDRIQALEVLAPAFIYGSVNVFPVSVQALRDCRVWAISKDSFFQTLQEDSVLLRNFLRMISDRSLFLSRKVQEFALESLSSRLVSYLKQQQSIQNLQEVAFVLGVARPSLSRAISMLVGKGVVTKVANKYVLTAQGDGGVA